MFRPKCLDRDAHARTRGKAIIDDDEGLSRQVGEKSRTSVELLAACELASLPLDDARDLALADPKMGNHLGINDTNAVACERSDRELFVLRGAELPHHKNIERRIQVATS
jgi:hypothetical protein